MTDHIPMTPEFFREVWERRAKECHCTMGQKVAGGCPNCNPEHPWKPRNPWGEMRKAIPPEVDAAFDAAAKEGKQ